MLTHKEEKLRPQSSDAADTISYVWQGEPPDSSGYVSSQLEHVYSWCYAAVPHSDSDLPLIIFDDWSAVYFNKHHHRWDPVSPPWVGGNANRSHRQRLLRRWLLRFYRAIKMNELPF